MTEANLIYDHTPPTRDFSKPEIDTKTVQKALRYIKEGEEMYSERKSDLEDILTVYFAGNSVFNGEGGTFMHSSLLYDIVQNHLEKEDFLEWSLISYGKTTLSKEEVATLDMAHKKLFNRVLVESGVDDAFSSEYGVRESRATQGESYLMVGKGKNTALKFDTLRLSQIKIPKGTLKWRDLKKLVLVFDVEDYDDFITEFSEFEKAKKLQWGNLPTIENGNINAKQNSSKNKRSGQYCIYIDLIEKTVSYIGGVDGVVFKELKGDEFPWKNNKKEPCFPIFRFIYKYPQQGFYCLGLGDLFYQTNALDEFIKNKKIKSIDNATRQYYIHNVDEGSETKWETALYEASEADINGRVAHITNIVSENSQGHRGSSLVGGVGAGLNESTFGDSIIDKNLVNKGVMLQEVGAETGKPLGTFQIETEKAQGKVKEVSVRNAKEYKRFLEFCHSLWIQEASTTDKSIVPINDESFISEKEFGIGDLTTGEVVEYGKSRDFFIEIDETTGVILNETLESQKGQFLLERTMGTPAYGKIASKLANRMGYDISEEDMLPVPEQAPQPQAPQQEQLPQ